MTEYYLWLLQLFGPANPKSLQLIQKYGSAENVYTCIKEENDVSLLTQTEIKRLPNATLENSRKIMTHCKRKGISIVTIEDKSYPYRLKNIFNSPILLFVKGNLEGLDDEVCICGVGTRSPSEYTYKIAHRTCLDLAKIGVILVSGMAVGVDNVVHQSAIEANSRTIGVLACGIDVDYPKGSIPVRERIYQSGGACISELFPSEKPSRTYFQARNRILAGLSMGVIVFQAGIGSGSLITAAHAVQQGRDLFCVPPHDIFASEYAGVIGFLRDGAAPLFNYLDVVNAFYNNFADKTELVNCEKYSVNPEKHFIFEKTAANAKADNDIKQIVKPPVKEYDISSYSDNHKKIIIFLKGGRKNLEAITSGTGISPEDISEYLIDLELDGVVSASPGANYELNNLS